MMGFAVLLLSVTLGGANVGTPQPVPLACTCQEVQQECIAQCRADLCRSDIFICNQKDPCNSTCKCEHCLP
jgi:hypothetical protein